MPRADVFSGLAGEGGFHAVEVPGTLPPPGGVKHVPYLRTLFRMRNFRDFLIFVRSSRYHR